MITIKRQILFLLFSIYFIGINAQNKTVYYGKPSTGGAEIHVFDDHTFKVIQKVGSYQVVENKYLVFDKSELDMSRFNVLSKTGSKTDSIIISFSDRLIILPSEHIYIGYKQKKEDTYTYLNLNFETKLFNTDPEDKAFVFKIPYATYVQFAYSPVSVNNGETWSYVESFKLPKNTTNVNWSFKYAYNNKTGLKIFAHIDENGKLSVDDRLFSIEKPQGDTVKKIATDSIAGWKIPLLVEKEAYKKFDNPKLRYQPVINISPFEYEEVFHKIETLQKAINLVKEDQSKILLIFNQLLDNNSEPNFEEIAREIEDYSNRYEWAAHLKNVIVYLAKPEDRKKLVKFKSEGMNEVLALNSNLETLYTEQIWTDKFREKYGLSVDDLSKKLVDLNTIYAMDSKSKSKTSTARDFLHLDDMENKKFLFKNIDVKRDIVEVVDDSELYNRTKKIKNSSAYFYLKNISSIQLKNEFIRLTNEHKNDKKVDLDYAQLALNYVAYDYIYNDIIGYDSFSKPKFYFDFCLYLSRFSTDISKIEVKNSSYENNIFMIGYVLKERGSAQYPEVIIATYKNLMPLKGFNSYFVSDYLNYAIANNEKPFDAFDAFYKSIIVKNKNYKNQIERYYNTNIKTQDERYPHNGINRLSDQISKAANSIAWEVVTKQSTNKNLITRAMEWSKMSLEIEPENHYYLDTYAHLLYFVGDTKKAVETELEAIKFATKDEDNESLKQYTETMEKMKKGILK